MKNILLILFLFFAIKTNAQTKGYNFQGVARDASGAIISLQKISLRFTIIATTPTGKNEYSEIRQATTDEQGVFSTVIGDGNAISTTGTVDSINWKLAPKYLKVEMDPTAGNSFFDMGTTQLRSVPYANYANYANSLNAENIIGAIPVSKGGTGLTTAGTSGQVLSSTANGTSIWTTPKENIKYSIGLNSSLGGYVFYLTPDSLHGLVCETIDQGVGISWDTSMARLNDPTYHSTAGKNFTDWRMPNNLRELYLMFDNRHKIGGFNVKGVVKYWSSLLRDSYYWCVNFGTRAPYNLSPHETSGVTNFRAIRSF